jgi:6-phosphofructokinase 2
MAQAAILTVTPNPALDVWTTTPKFIRGPKLRCTPPEIHPGGGGINVSRVVHRLGGETCALYAAGGRTGETVADGLRREGVPAEGCTIEGATREDFSVLATESGDVMRFVTPGPEVAAGEADDLLARLADQAAADALVVGSGSLPEGVGGAFWAKAAVLCRRVGARLVLDSHDDVGPALETGLYCFRETLDAVSGLAGRCLAWPDEAAGWADEQVRAGAAKIVIVTNERAGALMVQEGRRVRVLPPDVEPTSAIGAGDSFVAGFCLGLSRGECPDDALRRAVAAAAGTLLTPGTELCRPDDVDRLLSETGDAQRF